MTDGPERPGDEDVAPLLQLPDGTYVRVDSLIDRETAEGEKGLLTFMLQVGDIVAVQYDDEGQSAGYTFEVTEKTNPEDSPDAVVIGFLQGYGLPKQRQGIELTLVGAGWGGSMISTGILVTGRYPYFYSRTDNDEYVAPRAKNLQVLRKIGGEEYIAAEHLVRELPKR